MAADIKWWYYILMVLGALMVIPFIVMCCYGYIRTLCSCCGGGEGRGDSSGPSGVTGGDNELYAPSSTQQPHSPSSHRKKKRVGR